MEDTTANVTGLREGVEYEFRVSAENRAGRSQPSLPSQPAKYGWFRHLETYHLRVVPKYIHRIKLSR